MFALIVRVALASFKKNIPSRILSVFSMASVLVLAGGLFQIVMTFSGVMEDLRASRWITLYFSPSVTESQELVVASGIEKISGVREIQIVNKEAFVKNFEKYFPSLAKNLAQVDPDAIPRYLKLRIESKDLERVRKSVEKNRAIESVETNERRFESLIQVLSALRIVCYALLGGIAVLLLSWIVHRNRVNGRLQAELARSLKDLGASRFIRSLPGTIEGSLEGLAAGGLAACFLLFAWTKTQSGILQLFHTMGYERYPAQGMQGVQALVAIVFVGLFSGTIGSVWAYMRR